MKTYTLLLHSFDILDFIEFLVDCYLYWHHSWWNRILWGSDWTLEICDDVYPPCLQLNDEYKHAIPSDLNNMSLFKNICTLDFGALHFFHIMFHFPFPMIFYWTHSCNQWWNPALLTYHCDDPIKLSPSFGWDCTSP